MKNSPLKPVPKYGGFSPDPAALNAGENMTHDLNDYPTPYWERYIADLNNKALKNLEILAEGLKKTPFDPVFQEDNSEDNRRMEIVNKFLKEIGYDPEDL